MYVCIYSSSIITFNSKPTHQKDSLFFISFYTYILYLTTCNYPHNAQVQKHTRHTHTDTYRLTNTNTVLSLRMPTIRYAHAIQRYRYKRVSRDAAAMRRQPKGASVCSKRVLWGKTNQRQSVEAGGGEGKPKMAVHHGVPPNGSSWQAKAKDHNRHTK